MVRKQFTKEIDDFILEQRDNMTYKEISEKLGISVQRTAERYNYLYAKQLAKGREEALNASYKKGQKVFGIRYSTHSGNNLRRGQKVAGKILELYKHHVLLKTDKGWRECFQYQDLRLS